MYLSSLSISDWPTAAKWNVKGIYTRSCILRHSVSALPHHPHWVCYHNVRSSSLSEVLSIGLLSLCLLIHSEKLKRGCLKGTSASVQVYKCVASLLACSLINQCHKHRSQWNSKGSQRECNARNKAPSKRNLFDLTTCAETSGW